MIYYLTHYVPDSKSKLRYCISPAGQNKSAYFADILSRSDLDYEIVSWAEVDSDHGQVHTFFNYLSDPGFNLASNHTVMNSHFCKLAYPFRCNYHRLKHDKAKL